MLNGVFHFQIAVYSQNNFRIFDLISYSMNKTDAFFKNEFTRENCYACYMCACGTKQQSTV